MSNGNYLWFEGLDGCGKTTLCQAVAHALRAVREVLDLASPSGECSAVGHLIRRVFAGKEQVDPDAMLWLFVAEAKDVESLIRSWLARGAIVICDRHTAMSARVYQSERHDPSVVDAVISQACLLQADRTYLLDVPVEVALERRRSRKEAQNQLYESSRADDLQRLREKYLRLADEPKYRAKVLDATKPVNLLVEEVFADLGYNAAAK